MTNKEAITAGNTSLGIEFGSTRIKAVLVGPDNGVLAIGSHDLMISGTDCRIVTKILLRMSRHSMARH